MPVSEIPKRFSPTIDELLPAQTGNSGKVLGTDGTTASWQTVSGGVSDGDKGDITVSGGGGIWSINANVVADEFIRQSDGLSVIGRSASGVGNVADIVANSDGGVLRRAGLALEFGTISTVSIANDAVTYAKIQNVSATNRILGRSTVGAGDVEEITVGGDISQSGSTFTIGSNVVSNSKIRQSAGLSVMGRSANTTGDIADITAANDGEVLRRSGTTLGFGTVATTGIANSAVTYAKIQNVSATQRVLGRNTAGAGVTEEVSASGVLDWIGSTQGQILFRGASGWSVLSPGTSGQVLSTGGAGANPSWATASGSPFANDIVVNGVAVGRGGGSVSGNVTLGSSAMAAGTSGANNVAVGHFAMNQSQNANNSVAVGWQALTQGAPISTSIGALSLYSATGTNNTGVGYGAGYNVTTGTNNVFFGYYTGIGITTGGKNTIIGANVGGLSSSLSNNIIIADGDGNRRINVDSSGRVGIGTNTPSTTAILDITSTTGGVLFPRMTTTQRDAISTPVDGLVIYNSTTNKLQVRAASTWVDLH